MNSSSNYQAQSISQTYKALDTSQKGLGEKQALENLDKYGRNSLPDPTSRPWYLMFLRQFKNTMVYILLAAAIISFVYEHFLDVYVILGVIVINTVVGFFQEYRAEKSVQALKRMIVQKARVLRNGRLLVVSVHELVPGDMMMLDEGDLVPADGRLVAINNFQTIEAALTGESLPVRKQLEPVDIDTTLAEQTNMVWTGTSVSSGSAQAIITATGVETVLGKIAENLQSIEEQSDHFIIKTNTMAKQMTVVAIFTTGLTFIVGYFIRGFGFEEIFTFTIASLVSAIPEGLPVILTIVLAMSAQRMAKRNAIVRRLSATENLSVVDTIVTDKTGTLTQNKMTATTIQLPYQSVITAQHQDERVILIQDERTPSTEHYPLKKILDIAAVCHNIRHQVLASGEIEIIGDPTEAALVLLADRAKDTPSYSPHDYQQIADLTFNQERRWRASLVSMGESEQELFAIGSPETILAASERILMPDHHIHVLSDEHRGEIAKQIEHLANQGIRLLALAYKPVQLTKEAFDHDQVADLIYTGLIGIVDPPRDEVAQALKVAWEAGITTYMATGDHPDTAFAIAKEIGLLDADARKDDVITGAEIEKMTAEEIAASLGHVRVFARMTPEAKLTLAKVMQDKGMTVAMTGDGVNDAPALKQAEIGIAMGKNGTEVAKEAADIILSDDNYATIISAIEEGRTQFRNIRRTSFFYIITNLAESLALVVFLLVGLPIPLLPKQILWLNLVSSGVTDIALSMEPIHDDVLKTPPRKARENILARSVLPQLTVFTVTMVGISLVVYLILAKAGVSKGRTGVFVALACMQLFNLLSLRSLKKSVFSIGLFTNRAINIAVAVSVILLMVVIYFPPLEKLFDFYPLSLVELLYIILLSSLVLWISELMKAIKHYRN
jgi:P-type Ca2+ transporter type 2C